MNHNQRNLVLALLLLVTFSIPVVHGETVASTISVTLVNQDPDPATAGDTVDVRIGVQNDGDRSANDLLLEFVPSYPFQLVSGQEAVQKLGTIQGTSGVSSANIKVVKYTLRVDRDATAGDFDLKFKYYESGSTATSMQTVIVTIQGSETAEVIHINQTVLVPGKEDGLQFVINNVGTAPLRDLTFSWENADKAILPVGSDNTRYIKYIDVGESAELNYKVIADTNADPGLYLLSLHLKYTDSSGNGTKTITTQAGVYVGGGTDFDVAFSEISSNQYSFTVANIGSNPAYSVSVSVPDQRGWQVTGSNAAIIGNLNKGDYTVASFALQSSGNTQQNATGRSGQMPGQNPQGGFPRQMNASSMNISSDTVLLRIAYTDTKGTRQTVDKMVKVGSSARTTTGIQGFQGRQTQQNVFVKYKWYFIGFVVLVACFFVYRGMRKKKIRDQESRARETAKRK
jgi:hypothetical protein